VAYLQHDIQSSSDYQNVDISTARLFTEFSMKDLFAMSVLRLKGSRL